MFITVKPTRMAFFNVSASCLKLSNSFILAQTLCKPTGAVTENKTLLNSYNTGLFASIISYLLNSTCLIITTCVNMKTNT